VAEQAVRRVRSFLEANEEPASPDAAPSAKWLAEIGAIVYNDDLDVASPSLEMMRV